MAVALVDIRRGIRSLRRSPSFTLTALFVLALGIGANTAIFSIVYGILLRPLPYRDADRLVGIVAERDYDGRQQAVEANFSLADLEDWQAHSRAFESVALYASEAHALARPGGAEVVHGAYVTASFFETVGGRLALGRPLGSADDTSPAAVISHRLWLRRFGGSPSVLGQAITLTSQPYTIVGVADATFRLPNERTDVWTPAGFARTLNPWMAMRGNRGFHPIARLKPAATLVEARAHADAVAQALTRDHPSSYGSMRAAPVSLRDRIVGPVRPMLLIMFACVALVLVVACANVANLLLTRGTERGRDVAVRMALGASRGRIATESLIETGLLAAAGTILGTGLALGLVRAIVQTAPANVPRLDAVRLDLPVLLFSAALAVLTTVTIGMVPAWRSAGTAHELKVGHAGVKGGRTGRRLRRVLVVTELAVSLTLLVAASLLGRSLVELLRTDLGVTTERAVAAELHLAFGRSLTSAQQVALADEVLEHVASLPAVQSAGIGTALPPNRATFRITMKRLDRSTGGEIDYLVDAVATTPTFFRSLGVPLLRGRLFGSRDDARAQQVMIMSADTARHVFGEGDVIGQTLTLPFYRDGQGAARRSRSSGSWAT